MINKLKKMKIIYFMFFILVLISITGYAETEYNTEKIENDPFADYRKINGNSTEINKNNSDFDLKDNNKIIEIKQKRIEPDFSWKGLILVNGSYNVLLEKNDNNHIMQLGDKLNGYQVINIDSKKITLSKDNYIYYIKMRRE